MKKQIIRAGLILLTSAGFQLSAVPQFVVSDPAALQALERGNAMQIKDFTETVRSGQTLMEIQGMQKDMMDIYKKSQGFIEDMTMFVQIGERLVVLGKSFESFKPYENYFTGRGGTQMIGKVETVKSLYYMVESLISSCTREGLTPGDRVTMLTEVNNALSQIITIIEAIKSSIGNSLRNNAMNKMYNNSIYNSGGWGKMDVNFGTGDQ